MDCVDVDVVGDVKLFIDPRALRLMDSQWGDECRFLLRDFFTTVLGAIHAGDQTTARSLLAIAREPNETHLGLSTGRSQGRALGKQSAEKVAGKLATSEAARTGLLEDLEDTIPMVEGIGPDIISDIATNVIRGPLIRYTQAMCGNYGIALEEIGSGPIWGIEPNQWSNSHVLQPMAEGEKLLLVPKGIVRRKTDYDPGEYYRWYLLEHLRGIELSENSELVILLKSGGRRVNVKDLQAKYGTGKRASVSLTQQYPQVLDRYRTAKENQISPPLEHVEIAEVAGTELPAWEELLQEVLIVPQGTNGADAYHKAVEKLFSALFSTDLSFPEIEYNIHDGRKRIDIKYTNVAGEGFFKWVGDYAPAPYVYVECKNYSKDLANPELDQLAGRFSPRRGKMGILACRHLADKERFLQRCHDTATDDRGYIIALDDDDLVTLVEQAKNPGRAPGDYPLLRQRYDQLVV